MVTTIKTRNVSKELYRNYIAKAEEHFKAMNTEFENKLYNSCSLCAIHCCISAADALTVFFKGVRHAGDKHEDVVQLLESLDLDRETLKHKTRQLLTVLDSKNSVEYEEKLTSEGGALMMMKQTQRFFEWVKEMVPKL